MPSAALPPIRVAPSPGIASAVVGLFVYDCELDSPAIAIPRPEVQLVVRFGASTPPGVDAHAFGPRPVARRKLIRRGQRAVTVRFKLGAHQAVLGVPASAVAHRVVTLEELWGRVDAATLLDRLASAGTTRAAAALLDQAIAERLARTSRSEGRTRFAAEAAARLQQQSVKTVADELRISERHLRRIFRESVGVGPKEYAKLARFHRALGAFRSDSSPSWANIAAMAGYYDQAHLIADFHAIAGVTPSALLGELGRGAWIG